MKRRAIRVLKTPPPTLIGLTILCAIFSSIPKTFSITSFFSFVCISLSKPLSLFSCLNQQFWEPYIHLLVIQFLHICTNWLWSFFLCFKHILQIHLYLKCRFPNQREYLCHIAVLYLSSVFKIIWLSLYFANFFGLTSVRWAVCPCFGKYR